MNITQLPSRLLENAVSEFSRLPGIGKKTALRLVLHLLKQPVDEVELLGNSIIELRRHVKYCKVCNSLSEEEICRICSNTKRDKSTICVVESIKDVLAIESTQQYNGVYHVLGGIISPIDGIGPSDLAIESLEQRVSSDQIKEVIFALSTTMEGDTTNFYLFKRLNRYDVNITTLARGVAIGDELEYADEITLGRSIVNRMPFQI